MSPQVNAESTYPRHGAQAMSNFPERGSDDYQNLLNEERDVRLSNIEILQLAYTVGDLVEYLIEKRAKLAFEEANSMLGAYYTMRRLLQRMDNHVSNEHENLLIFFGQRGDRELSNDWDRLSWEAPVDTSAASSNGDWTF